MDGMEVMIRSAVSLFVARRAMGSLLVYNKNNV
jgi:hypothetical protein